MDPDVSKYSKELKTAVEAAKSSGEIIDRFEGNAEGWSKEDGSVVTEADIESQQSIVETIQSKFPEDGFLGEEEHLEPEGEKRVWIIDPVDGTFNFDSGFPFYGVSIALEIDGEAVVGVLHFPDTSIGRTYFAVKDSGSWVSETHDMEEAERISVSGKEEIEGSIFFHTLFNVYEDEPEAELSVMERFVGKGAVHRQLGSAAAELAFLAEGRAEFLVNPIEKKVDFKAGKLIVEEAGGSVRVRKSRFGESFEVLASNGKVQEEVEETVEDIFV